MIRCSNCDAPLAHDQRYCVECGARRRPLPERVAATIAAIRNQSRRVVPVRVVVPDPEASARRGPAQWIPTPRVAALAVLGMLAFGAEVGALVGASGIDALAHAPLIVLKQDAGAPANVAPSNQLAQAPSDSGASAAPQTITIYETAPGSGGSGGSGGSSPASTAPATTTTSTSSTTTTPTNPNGLPPIKHVFVIVLSDQGYRQTFGSQDPYLAKTLPKQGKLFDWYYGVAGGELANQVGLISGQGPTAETAADCPTFANVTPGTIANHKQVLGHGCVYPKKTPTLGAQMTAAHLTWKAYIQGMASTTPGQPQACRHPAVGQADADFAPRTGDPYVTWRNPFVYFHSVIDSKTCQKDDVDLTQLSTDLTNESTTPNLSYIVPNPCDDGSDQPCTTGATAGVAGADNFLRTIVPEIKSSPAYQAGGLIAITFDQAPQTGANADSSACCQTPKYPNLPAGAPSAAMRAMDASTDTTTTSTSTDTTTSSTTSDSSTSTTTTTTTTASTTTPAPLPSAVTPTVPVPAATTTTPTTATGTPTTGIPTTPTTTTTSSTTTTPGLGAGQGETTPTGGGGQVGLLLISPWIKKNTIDVIDYLNHYSLLEGIENIFDLKHLGYANVPGLATFDAGTFDGTGPSGS